MFVMRPSTEVSARRQSPAAIMLCVIAFAVAQLAFTLHANAGDGHDVTGCVACHLGDRLDDTTTASIASAIAPLRVATAASTDMPSTAAHIALFSAFSARAPPAL